MPRLAFSILLCACVLAGLEGALRASLFHHVSYSNSQSIDAQLVERDAFPYWNVLFAGDSEIRWGIHPQEIDKAFRRVGVEAHAFNHAFDGFGASWWPALLPPLLRHPSLNHTRIVVLGVQMIDAHQIIAHPQAQCAALQEPVLTSAFGEDLGLRSLCRRDSWDTALGYRLFSWLWTVRYASAVKNLLIPTTFLPAQPLRFNSRKSGAAFHGFEPHYELAHDREGYAEELRRWKAQYNPPRDFQPLAPEAWISLTRDGGFFDHLLESVRREGRELALFASPTNPVVIDTFARRRDYEMNSLLLHQWAHRRGVTFVDLGILDVENPDCYFSDMRHLSGEGARLFSQRLGEALVHSLSKPSMATLGSHDPDMNR
ncbi:MAG: hypothetical protein P0111_04490 [Nitrospira sp.]|nr:hypothetical protein [Nitrospira sp.]